MGGGAGGLLKNFRVTPTPATPDTSNPNLISPSPTKESNSDRNLITDVNKFNLQTDNDLMNQLMNEDEKDYYYKNPNTMMHSHR
jgi:hypothetical protein